MGDFDINATLGLKSAEPGEAAQKFRGNRFDRADFAARRPTMLQEKVKQPLLPVRPATKDASAEPPAAQSAMGSLTAASTSERPTDEAQITEDHLRELGWSQDKIQKILGGPEQAEESTDVSTVDPTAQAEVHLLSIGWSKSDIARLLVGPQESHLTAEALFRQHAANSTREQEALMKALAQAGAQKIKPDPALLSGLNTAHLNPESPSDLEQLISQFAALPDVQKQRFLLLLDAQKPTQKTASPKADAPPKKAGGTEGGTSTPSGSAGDVLPVVKSSLDLLSTALKGILGSTKEGTKKGASGPGKGTTGKNSPVDESDPEDPASPPEDERADEDASSSDDISDTSEDMNGSWLPEEPMDSGSEREPD